MSEIVTRVAALGFPEHRFRGYAVFGELVGNESYASLVALAVTGRRLSRAESALLDDVAAVTSVADPRIWPLKLTRVVSSYGGLLPGFAAGQLPTEGDRIGPPITRHAAELLVELREAVGERIDDDGALREAARELVARRKRLVGYGIPFRAYDERYVVLRDRLTIHGRNDHPFARCERVLSEVVLEVRGLVGNIGILAAATLLDLGMTPHEVGATFHFIMLHTFIGNAFESSREPASELQRLPPDAVKYVGRAPRRSPRAKGG